MISLRPDLSGALFLEKFTLGMLWFFSKKKRERKADKGVQIKKNSNMNLIKKILLGTLVVGTFTFSFAQKIDAKAKTILDAVSANYKAKKNTYFKFSY